LGRGSRGDFGGSRGGEESGVGLGAKQTRKTNYAEDYGGVVRREKEGGNGGQIRERANRAESTGAVKIFETQELKIA